LAENTDPMDAGNNSHKIAVNLLLHATMTQCQIHISQHFSSLVKGKR
jgi:hypothetical protein